MPKGKKIEGSGKPKGAEVNQLSEADYANYISEYINLKLTKSYSTYQLNHHFAGKGLSYHQCLKVNKGAAEAMKQMLADKTEDAYTTAIMNLEELMAEARAQGDTQGALKVQIEINKLNQLYTQKIEVNGALTIPSVINVIYKSEE